jgi:hypothetical protein
MVVTRWVRLTEKNMIWLHKTISFFGSFVCKDEVNIAKIDDEGRSAAACPHQPALGG